MDRPEPAGNPGGSVDDVLAHFGVKGMKWGVRRARDLGPASASQPKPGGKVKVSGGAGQPAHADALSAKTAARTVKKSGTQSLSNKELQALVSRMNLEQQYSNLNGKGKKDVFKRIEDGQKQAKILAKTGKTLVEAAKIAAPIALFMYMKYTQNGGGGSTAGTAHRVYKTAGAIGRPVRAITAR